VGEGVVRSWLRAGATVVTMSRDPGRLTQLVESTRDLGGRLITGEGSPSDPDAVTSLSRQVDQYDQVVASIGGGGWQLAPLTALDPTMFQRIFDDGIIAHWAVANVMLPRLTPTGEYVFINGGAALSIVSGTGPLSLVASAQLTLAATYAAEMAATGPRITSLILNTPIATRSRASTPPHWLTPDQVGDACIHIHALAEMPDQIILDGADSVATLQRRTATESRH